MLGTACQRNPGVAVADINFADLTMRVTRAVVDGVVDKVKTEYSEDDLPLDPDLATVLLNWKRHCPDIGGKLGFPHGKKDFSPQSKDIYSVLTIQS